MSKTTSRNFVNTSKNVACHMFLQIVSVLEQSMDKFISILIILSLLVGAVLMTFFVAVQVKLFVLKRTV